MTLRYQVKTPVCAASCCALFILTPFSLFPSHSAVGCSLHHSLPCLSGNVSISWIVPHLSLFAFPACHHASRHVHHLSSFISVFTWVSTLQLLVSSFSFISQIKLLRQLLEHGDPHRHASPSLLVTCIGSGPSGLCPWQTWPDPVSASVDLVFLELCHLHQFFSSSTTSS